MSDFEARLQKAVQRGEQRRADRQRAELQEKLSEEQLKSLHGKYRLQLSERIEEHMQKLPDLFPGFQYQAVFGEKGWGAACSRDDFGKGKDRQRDSLYSRVELTIRPYSELGVVELTGKGTIRNKEVFNRNYFEEIPNVDPDAFIQRIDYWIIEFAELFAAKD